MAIWFYNKKTINKSIWYTAVVLGGIMGMANTYFGAGGEYLPLAAMGITAVLSVLSIKG